MTETTMLIDEIIDRIEASNPVAVRIHVSVKADRQLRLYKAEMVTGLYTILGHPVFVDSVMEGISWGIVHNDPIATKLEQQRWERGLFLIARRWEKCDTPADRSKAEALHIAAREFAR